MSMVWPLRVRDVRSGLAEFETVTGVRTNVRLVRSSGPAMANSTRLRWEALGRFPQRVKFSARYTGYRTQDILAWMAACERRSAEESNEQRQRILEQEAARARQKRWK